MDNTIIIEDLTENVTIEVVEGYIKGDKGDTGDQGEIGLQGEQGLQGEEGFSAYQSAVNGGFVGTEAEWVATIKGEKGDTGDQGIQGIQGETGLKGDTGDQGIQGIQGVQGVKGDTGDQGIQGIDGVSAYQSAVNGGFVGTEIEWIASLEGEQGIQGIQGIQGETGLTGATGEGVPIGGTVGQILDKVDGTDFNTQWVTKPTSNATHTGEIIGATVLTADPTIISNKTLKAVPIGTEEIIINDAGTLKKTTLSALLGTIQLYIGYALSDETTDLAVGLATTTFRMPYAMTVTGVRASVTTAPTGSNIIVDINDTAVSILSTKLSIDVSEKTSTTATTAVNITTTALTDDAEITIDIDQIGSTIAGAGLKVYLIGTRV